MSFKNYILRVLRIIRPRVLTQTSKTFSSFSFSTTSNSTGTDPTVFFFLGILFPLFWVTVFDIRSSKTSSSRISGLMQRRSQNAFVKTWLSCFLFRVEELRFLVFIEEIRGLDPYIKSDPGCIRFFDIWKNYRLSCFSFCASCLAFLSFSLFLASCFFFNVF